LQGDLLPGRVGGARRHAAVMAPTHRSRHVCQGALLRGNGSDCGYR
jgi:hypothetical protein